MHGRALLVALLLVAVTVSGCIGSASVGADEGLGNELLATQTSDEPDAGLPGQGAFEQDPWAPNETARLLFEGSVQTEECLSSPEGVVLEALGSTAYGCARVVLPPGMRIPYGTGTLQIEADATKALQRGAWRAEVYTMGRNTPTKARTPDTSEPVRSWEIPLSDRDWDPQTIPDSIARIEFWAANEQGRVSTLDGEIAARLTAVRDPGWVPRPLIDPWNATADHAMPQPGVITLLDATLPWDQPATHNRIAGPRLTDTVPSGTAFVVVGITWEAFADCPTLPGLECRIVADLTSDGADLHWSTSRPERHFFDRATIQVWPAPTSVVWDPEDETESLTSVESEVLYMCAAITSCGGPPQPEQTEATFLVEAWNGPVDLAAFRERLAEASAQGVVPDPSKP
jgi:hypothetical protein